MANIEANKAFVRSNVPEDQQQQFLNYFYSIKDHQRFSEWPLSKVYQQTVNDFKMLKKSFSLSTNITIIDQINKDGKVQSKQKEQGAKSPEKSHYKSSINYLQEIQKSVQLSSSNRKAQFRTNNLQNWLKIDHLPSLQPQKLQSISQKPNPFQNFDQLINSLNIAQNPIQNDKNLLIKSTSKNFPSKNAKQKQFHSSNSKMVDKIKDKLYKWKMSQKIKCKVQIQLLNCQDLNIQSHQMIHRIFLPDYVLYHIKIIPSGIICIRNYNDFICLRENLQIIYPYTIVPYLQNISWLSQSDITLIQKHKQNLAIFLKKLINHPILGKADIVKDFLSVIEHKAITQKLQSYEKRKFKCLNDIQSPSGQYQLHLSEEKYRKIQKMPKWSKFLQNYFSGYNQLLQTLSAQLKNVENTYAKLANMSIQMQNKLKSLHQYGICQLQIKQSFQQLFKQQQKYYQKKKNMVGFQILNFEAFIVPLINDQKKNTQMVSNIHDKILKLNERYIKRLQNEPQSPSSISQTYRDLSENVFKESLWCESQNIKLLKYQVSFINTNISQQYQFLNKSLIAKLGEHWQKIIQRQSQYTQVLEQRRGSLNHLEQ